MRAHKSNLGPYSPNNPKTCANCGLRFSEGWPTVHCAAIDWQPIESAPKDGTRVLLWIPRNDRAMFALDEHAVSGEWVFDFWRRGDDHVDHLEPTHWAPLNVPGGGEAE